MTGTLILLRHGESEWNAKNLFTGWVDVGLSPKGEAEATRGGELLVENNLLPDVMHTSVLRRAIQTGQMSLDVADRMWIETKRSWRLNERHYGALQGKDKAATLAEFGEEQFMLWRRSYDIPPPPIDNADQFANFDDPKYAGLPSRGAPAYRMPQRRADPRSTVLVRPDCAGPARGAGDLDRCPWQLAARHRQASGPDE